MTKNSAIYDDPIVLESTFLDSWSCYRLSKDVIGAVGIRAAKTRAVVQIFRATLYAAFKSFERTSTCADFGCYSTHTHHKLFFNRGYSIWTYALPYASCVSDLRIACGSRLRQRGAPRGELSTMYLASCPARAERSLRPTRPRDSLYRWPHFFHVYVHVGFSTVLTAYSITEFLTH